ncbi:MAG: hypothetical protein ACOX50_04175 [Patescibacteria group bacterium]|jgi:hypothetical protein
MENNQTHKTSNPNYNKKLLEVLSIRPIAFNPLLAKATGSIKAGLLLAQLLYWWQKGRDKDWIYKTIKEIEEETALSRNEQDSAIKRLKQLGLIEVKLKKVPARRHFHLSLLKISNLVCGSSTNLFDESQQSIPENTAEMSSTPLGAKHPKRKDISFKQELYQPVLEEYQRLKGITLQGEEFLPVQREIKTMLMSGRTPEQIIAVMRHISQKDWIDWTIRTVKIRLPDILPKLGLSPKSNREPTELEKKLVKAHEGGGQNG